MEHILSDNIHSEKKIYSGTYFSILVISLVLLVSSALYFLLPDTIQGDGVSYVQSIQVLSGGVVPADFVPNRILTTYLGLQIIRLFTGIFGNLMFGWICLNVIFYFILTIALYTLIIRIFKNEKVALVGTLFIASNYALLSFGLNYLLDIGGMTFYILSLIWTLYFLQSGNYKNIIYSALCVGIGGLFKEYAFLGAIPIILALIYEYKMTLEYIRKSSIPGILILLPISFVTIFVFNTFHYTYANWFGVNQTLYVYHSRLIEYIKSFGSLVNFLGIFFVLGLYVYFKDRKDLEIDIRTRFFIMTVVISSLPIFFWPAITQRILFATVPTIILIACFFLKKIESKIFYILPALALYVYMSFFMDSYILAHLNLPF